MGDNEHWQTKTTYLKKVTGNEIVEEQDKINDSKNQFTIGSIIIPVTDLNGTTGEFYAWITYKVNPMALKSLDKETGKIIVEKPLEL